MFDFGNANDAQRAAISITDGPVLITAGPGTGKTFTLVQRTIYLIEEKKVKISDNDMQFHGLYNAKKTLGTVVNRLEEAD